MGMRGEARGRCDLRQVEATGAQEKTRLRYAAVDNVIVRCFPDGAFESAIEESCRQPEMRRDLANAQLFVQASFNEFIDAPKALRRHPAARTNVGSAARKHARDDS